MGFYFIRFMRIFSKVLRAKMTRPIQENAKKMRTVFLSAEDTIIYGVDWGVNRKSRKYHYFTRRISC